MPTKKNPEASGVNLTQHKIHCKSKTLGRGLTFPIRIQNFSETCLNGPHSHSFENMAVNRQVIWAPCLAYHERKLFGPRTCLWGVRLRSGQLARDPRCPLGRRCKRTGDRGFAVRNAGFANLTCQMDCRDPTTIKGQSR